MHQAPGTMDLAPDHAPESMHQGSRTRDHAPGTRHHAPGITHHAPGTLHPVSHFSTFFIDAGAEISVAESISDTRVASPPARAPSPSRRGRTKRFRFPWRVWRRVFVIQPGGDRQHKVRRLPTRGGPRSRTPLAIPHTSNKFAGRTACEASTMILPQVHLRKPCYDFSFL
ncbi:hypothetical protein RIF29_02084 [Crotalaria pallida]|uniref:Uncharacterized protein n=1 Tax=Crotalaria pallida TaxID=3830 RepID=A0AAN9P7R7_CROPI